MVTAALLAAGLPEFFQVVERPGLGKHQVHDDIVQVHQHPLGLAVALHAERLHAVLLVAGREHWLGTDAIWRAATRLRWPWRALTHLRWFPRWLREAVYRFIADRRPRREPRHA